MTSAIAPPAPSSLDADLGVELAGVAARHGGIVLASEAEAVGMDSVQLSRAVRRKLIVRVRRGAYAAKRRWDDADERLKHLLTARAVLRSLDGGVWFTHVTGLLAYGLELHDADLSRIHVVRSGATVSGRTEAGCVHSVAELPESHRGLALGLPVVSPARCLVDHARSAGVTEEQAIVPMDHALRLGLTTRDELRAVVEECRDWPGSIAGARATSSTDGRAESVGETLTRLGVTRVGFPPEELQIEIRTPDGTYRADMGWPSLRVLLEFDGKGKFGRWLRPGESPSDAAWRERRREVALERAGWIVVRVCWADLFDEARLRAILLDAFARAAARQRLS